MSNNNATVDFNANIDLSFGEQKRARLQNYTDFPNASGVNPGWIIFHTVLNSAFVWTGNDWLNLGQLYTHPTYTLTENLFQTELTSGLRILSQLLTNSTGHVIKIAGRDLTNADILGIFLNDAIQSGTYTWSSNKIKTFVENTIGQSVTGALVYQPVNYIPATTANTITPPTPSTVTTIKQGMVWVVSATGFFGSQAVEPGDMVIAKMDNAASVESNYQIINKNIDAIVQASEDLQGIIEIATEQEALDGVAKDKAITPETLKTVLDTKIGGFTSNFGDASSTSFTFYHSLNSENPLINVYRNSDNKLINVAININGSDSVEVNVINPPDVNEYRIVMMARNY